MQYEVNIDISSFNLSAFFFPLKQIWVRARVSQCSEMSEFIVSWANLPPELLFLIAKRLETDTEIRNFRAVCKPWLSSTFELPPRSPTLPMHLRLRYRVQRKNTMSSFTLFQTTIYRLELPGVFPKKSWLIKVSEQADGRFRLMNPFSSSPVRNFPDDLLPREFNLLNFGITEVCKTFYLRLNSRGTQDPDAMPCYKAALPSDFESIKQKFLVIDEHARLLCPKDGNIFWKRIDRNSEYIDFVHYKDKFFALDWNGVTRVFEESTFAAPVVLSLPSDHLCLCGQWYLVKSCGDLYLVGKIQHRGMQHPIRDGDGDIIEAYGQFIRWSVPAVQYVEFKVYKLDDSDPIVYKWHRVTDLGDRIFFISRNCSYSVSVHDFGNCTSGNVIIFEDEVRNKNNNDPIHEPRGIAETRVGFCNLKVGRVLKPLSLIPAYYAMFWPPPNWLMTSPSDQGASSSTT